MTKRAVFIGFLLGAFIAGFTHINNNVIQQSGLIENFMPISVYGLLVLSLITINPLLKKIRPAWTLKGNEYAVILAIGLAACAVPGSGLLRFFPNLMMRPHQWVKTRGGWVKHSPLQKMPHYMMAGRLPEFAEDDFTKPVELATNLVAGAENDTLPSNQARIWELMTEDGRDALNAVTTDSGELQAVHALQKALNGVLPNRELFRKQAFPTFSLTLEGKQILLHAGSDEVDKSLAADHVEELLSGHMVRSEHVRAFNRHLVDAAWPNHIHSRASRYDEDLSTYLLGQGDLNKPVAVKDVPWKAWARPLAYWMPIFIVVSIGVIALSLVIHTQWSRNENLPYPLVQFTNTMLPDNDGNASELYKRPSFWWAGGVVLAIFSLNYLNLQFPEIVPKIPLDLDFSALRSAWKPLDNGGAQWAMLTVRLVPMSIGIAYLVRSDVSLSVGISIPLHFILMYTLGLFGVSMSTSSTSGGRLFNCNPHQLFTAGAALAFAFQVFYYGRGHYVNVVKRALFIKANEDDAPKVAVLGARVFMVCAAAISTYLMCAGVDWFLAIAYTLIAFTLFLVLSRIVAETGIFFLLSGWYPCTTILGLLGINAIGPGTAIIMFMFSSVLLVRPKECLMPFAVGALKLLDDQNVKPKSAAPWMVGSVILAILIAVPITLSYQHGTGSSNPDGWANAVSQYPFAKSNHMSQALKARNRYEDVEATSGLARFARVEMDPKVVLFFCIGAVTVIGLSFLRLRFRWWPIHPVIVLVFSEQSTVGIWHSFLAGWIIRTAVVKYGGHQAYSKGKPIVMGLIAGNILGLLLPNLVGAIYYFVSGGDRLVSPPMF